MSFKWFFMVLLDLTCACFCDKVGYAPILVLNNLAEFIATRVDSKHVWSQSLQHPPKKKINMAIYFENIIATLLLFLFLKYCQIKFYVNRMLFIIWSINLVFLYIILYYKKLEIWTFFDNITIDLWIFKNFASMKDMRRKCNLMWDLSKIQNSHFIKRYWVEL